MVEYLHACYSVSIRRACQVVELGRSTNYYTSRADPQTALRVRLRDLAESRVQYGYRRLHVLLRREGWPVNAKQVYRLYDQEGLALRTKTRRRRRSGQSNIRSVNWVGGSHALHVEVDASSSPRLVDLDHDRSHQSQ